MRALIEYVTAAFRYLRRTPSAGLLVVQLCGLVLYPLMETSPRGRAFFGAFSLLVLGVALRVVKRSPALTWVAVVLALVVVTLALINLFSPHRGLQVARAALSATFYFYAAGSLIAYMLRDTEATTDELFASGATFTLLAWAFAYAYVACQAAVPGSFGPERSWLELLFLSVALLSSVGLSDILPVLPMARGLVMLEAFAGVMYIALVVSRLIALTVSQRKERT